MSYPSIPYPALKRAYTNSEAAPERRIDRLVRHATDRPNSGGCSADTRLAGAYGLAADLA